MTPNDYDMPKVKNTRYMLMHVTYTSEAHIFVRFALRWAMFELRPNFRESARNDPKWPWQGPQYQHAWYIHPPSPFRSTMSRFWVTVQFSKKCTQWRQMTLTCSESQCQHACYIHPETHVFLGYCPIFWKVHRMTPNDVDMFKVKNTNMHATYTPEAQLFISFALRWPVFQLRPNFGKSAPNYPKMTLTCSRSKVHILILHTSPRPKLFVRFALRWAVFEQIEIFEFCIGYNVKI